MKTKILIVALAILCAARAPAQNTISKPLVNPANADWNLNGHTITNGHFAIRDTSAAFDVTLAATSSTTLTAGRTLTLDVGNVAHTIAFGTIANTITFPSVTSDTVLMAAAAQSMSNKKLASLTTNGPIYTSAGDGTLNSEAQLAVARGGTGLASFTIGDVIYASGSTTLSKLADVAVGSFLRSGGTSTAPAWSTTTWPNSATTGDLVYANASNSFSGLADVAAGSFLRSGGTSTAPAWSATTWPNSATLGDINYASAANTFSVLAGNTTTTKKYLSQTGNGSTSAAPAWAQIDFADLSGTVSTAQIANNAVDNTKIRDSGALSVIGRSANTTGDPADISATAASGAVLRESGSTVGFGTIATAGITNNAVDDTKLRQGGALSVIGRSANSIGNVADISATAASGAVLRESGSTVGFGAIATAGITNNAVDDTKLRQGGALSVIGRSANSIGNVADISTSADGDVLRRSGTTLGFGSIATAGITDAAVTYAKIQNVSATNRALGRKSAGAGVIEELVPGTDYTSPTSTESFQNKTFNSNDTGNVLKKYEYAQLTFPDNGDGTNATRVTTEGATYGHFTFSNSVAKTSNYVLYRWRVPDDLDTAVELGASFSFRLGGADTGKHAYEISMADCATSASCDNPTFSNAIAMNFGGDASGASGDMEQVPSSGFTQLTTWKTSLTAGHIIVVKMARAGDDATNDTSTVNSTDLNLTIRYGSTQ